MEKPVLVLEDVSKFYTSGQNVVVGLNGIRASFCRGEFVAITGESGSGKSTLAHVLSGILPYEGGEMYIDGCPTSHYDSLDWERYRRDNISFISQNYGILLSATVLENVVSALYLTGMDKKAAAQEAKAILEKVELWPLRRRRAAKLSSGQKQRLAIARALAKPTPILIADEPTGNLDPENSAKVIKLLAQAAQDRLVLLITHDFPEAQDCATRRVSLQDGRVVMDAVLRPAATPEKVPAAPKKKKRLLSLYAARLQLVGRPIWGSAVLALLALTAFAVFAFLGTFIVAMDDTPTRIYDNTVFRNGDQTRLVIQRADGAPMTQADYDALLQVPYAQRLEKYGMIADINVFYRENEDYFRTFHMVNVGTRIDPIMEAREEIDLRSFDAFAQTVPLMAENSTFLTAGRLPEHYDEVVLAGDESQIGQTFTVYLADDKNWATREYIGFDVTVVGVTDVGSHLYFHADVGRIFTHNNNMTTLALMPYPSQEVIEASDAHCFRISTKGLNMPNMYREGLDYYQNDYAMALRQLTVDGEFLWLAREGPAWKSTYPRSIAVTEEVFQLLTPQGADSQVSLFLEHYAYTDRALEAVKALGYIAVSPYQLGATTQVEALAQERIQTLLICAAVLLVVLVLQVLVLRALFGSEVDNYQLMANIGLTCKAAQLSVLWQILLFTLAGQAAGAAALWYCNSAGVERIVSIVRYLPPNRMALLSAVHLMAAVLAAWWTARAVRKRVYPLFVRSDDLKLDDGEELA